MFRRFALLAALPLFVPAVLPAAAGLSSAVDSLRAAAGGPVEIVTSATTGRVEFFTVDAGRGVDVTGAAAATAAERALSFLSAYGEAFGVDAAGDVAVTRSVRDELGMDHVRVQQLRGGVPVAGGELAVHLRDGAVVAANGRLSAGLDGLDVAPAVSASTAVAAARELAARSLGAADAEIAEPRL